MKILVIEDHAEMREFIGRMLKSKTDFTSAESAEEGIKAFDCDMAITHVLTDRDNPIQDGGLDVIRHVMGSGRRVVVGLMSGRTTDIESEKLRVDATLAKPFRLEALEQFIQLAPSH